MKSSAIKAAGRGEPLKVLYITGMV